MEAFLAALVGFVLGLVPAHSLSYISAATEELQPPKAHVLFAGDMMFDRSIRNAIDKKGGDFIFSCVDPLLKKDDAVVANLEGPITIHRSVSTGSAVGGPDNFTFTFSTSTAALLAAHGIGIVSIGNNHIMNFKREGLLETKQWLSGAGVQYFGDPDAVEADRVLRTTIKGVRFSFVNWSDWTSDKTDHTVAQVRAEAATGRVVVVYTHWGEEYVAPLPRVVALAHEFVDAGAAIVIGSHPHIIQEHELYRGKPIYYSLGNFIFDQYWDDTVRTGLLLDVTFGSRGVEDVHETRVQLERDRRTCPTS